MKTAAVLTAFALALSVAVGTALADGLPVPSLPSVPSVPTPPVTVPVAVPHVSIPKLPVSTPKTSTHVATPSVARSAPSISVASGGISVGTSRSGASAATGSSGGFGGGSASSYGTTSETRSGPPIARLRTSRPWVAQRGPANRRRTVLNFQLPAASRVIFSVTQVAPVCRAAGHFAISGKQGLNKVVFRGRLNGHALAPGTYKITARVPGKGTVLRVTVVIVGSGVPTPSELALARKSDVCSAAARGLANSTAGTSANGSGTRAEAAPSSSAGGTGSGGSSAGSSSGPSSGIEGANVTLQSTAPFSPARVSKNVRNPLVIFALAAAILLLGLAALPKTAIPDPRLTDVLVRHRVEVALAGAAALTAALITLALA